MLLEHYKVINILFLLKNSKSRHFINSNLQGSNTTTLLEGFVKEFLKTAMATLPVQYSAVRRSSADRKVYSDVTKSLFIGNCNPMTLSVGQLYAT